MPGKPHDNYLVHFELAGAAGEQMSSVDWEQYRDEDSWGFLSFEGQLDIWSV